MAEPSSLPDEECDVSIFAPLRRDALAASEAIRLIGRSVRVLDQEHHLKPALHASKCLVITQEGITPRALDLLEEELAAQESWSEFPIFILMSDDVDALDSLHALLTKRWDRSRRMYYRRPLSPLELTSGLQTALSTRERQLDLRRQLAREATLRRELNHCVKNILATVQSMCALTKRQSKSPERLFADFEERLQSLSAVHRVLLDNAARGADLHAIAALVFAPYEAFERSRIRIDGPQMSLTADAATTLGMCMHELATNALKYGSLSTAGGLVALEWRLDYENDVMSLRWIESASPAVCESSRTGFGMRYLSVSLEALFGNSAQIDFASGGLALRVKGSAGGVRVPPENGGLVG